MHRPRPKGRGFDISVKYNVKLKNDNTVYQTYTSLKGVQIGDTIDIFTIKKVKKKTQSY